MYHFVFVELNYFESVLYIVILFFSFFDFIVDKILAKSYRTNSEIMVNQNQKQKELDEKLSMLLPRFTSLNDYEIYLINDKTSTSLLHDLIPLARATGVYTIDTELDYFTHVGSLIQIEFIGEKSVVLLIETCHLPTNPSLLFWLITSLLQVVLKPSNLIYAWGNIKKELKDFLEYELFTKNMIKQLGAKDIQKKFKNWYNQVFVHTCSLPPLYKDNISCKCTHRPMKNPSDAWSLQRAIAYTFNEYHDKTCRNSEWSRRLDYINSRKLISYAVRDCLTVSKLVMVIDKKFTKQQLEQYNTNSHPYQQ